MYGLTELDRIVQLGVVRYALPTGMSVADAIVALRDNVRVDTIRNEDVVSYDPSTGNYVLVVDGSDRGLGGTAIDGLNIESNGDMLMSFKAAFAVPGLTGGPSGSTVDDSDIVRFTPSSLGANSSGVFTFYFGPSS